MKTSKSLMKILGIGTAGLSLFFSGNYARADTAEEINNLAQMQAQFDAQQRQLRHEREMQQQQQEFLQNLANQQREQKANEQRGSYNEADELLLFACYNKIDADNDGCIDIDDLREVPGKGTNQFKVGQEVCLMSIYLKKWTGMTAHLTLHKGDGDIEWELDYKIDKYPGNREISSNRYRFSKPGMYVLERKIIETGRKDFLMVKIEDETKINNLPIPNYKFPYYK